MNFRRIRQTAGLVFLISVMGCALLQTGRLPNLDAAPEVEPGQFLATGSSGSTLMSLAHTSPTWTKRPTPERSATPSITPLTPSAAPSSTPTLTLTPTPTFLLCSPVEPLSLALLWKYVAVPYLPPPMGEDRRHQGIDITYYQIEGVVHPIDGDPVQSVLRGRVASVIVDSFPFGNSVIIETPRDFLLPEYVERLQIGEDQSLYLLYAHLKSLLDIRLGDSVAACQRLGQVGATGNTDAAHLHVETRLGPPGMSFEEFGAFRESYSELAKENYALWRTSGVFKHFDPMLLLDPQHLSPTVTPTPD